MMSDMTINKLHISIAAGKGGTGKTLLSTSLALTLDEAYSGHVQLVDCDVEEPNAHLLMNPTIHSEAPVHVLVPEVHLELCTRCGKCAQTCQSSAIAVIRQAVLTFNDLCAGCGACAYVCPVDAITEINRQVGTVSQGTVANSIEFVTGRLAVGDQRATPVTKAVKNLVNSERIAILDAPPGTACPMQETVEDTDYCILITEPTPFGLSNLKDAVETCAKIGVPHGVVINRDGAGDDGVEKYCAANNIDVLLRIPQSRAIAEAYARGETLSQALHEWREPLVAMYDRIAKKVQNAKQ